MVRDITSCLTQPIAVCKDAIVIYIKIFGDEDVIYACHTRTVLHIIIPSPGRRHTLMCIDIAVAQKA